AGLLICGAPASSRHPSSAWPYRGEPWPALGSCRIRRPAGLALARRRCISLHKALHGRVGGRRAALLGDLRSFCRYLADHCCPGGEEQQEPGDEVGEHHQADHRTEQLAGGAGRDAVEVDGEGLLEDLETEG